MFVKSKNYNMDFYSAISDYYNEIFPVNPVQLSFILNCTPEHENKKLLDVGCGTGGLPINLINKFKSISAIDTNKQMLDIAWQNSGKMNIDFKEADMLNIQNIFENQSFDVVVCFGNTLVHLNNIDEITSFFMQAKALLNPGGKLLFQIINYDNVLDNSLSGLPTIENEHVRFVRNYNHKSNGYINFNTILTIKETGNVLENNVNLYPVRKIQLEKALKYSGYNVCNSYGSFKKDPYNHVGLPLIYECYHRI